MATRYPSRALFLVLTSHCRGTYSSRGNVDGSFVASPTPDLERVLVKGVGFVGTTGVWYLR